MKTVQLHQWNCAKGDIRNLQNVNLSVLMNLVKHNFTALSTMCAQINDIE